jgi:hypothetical protein
VVVRDNFIAGNRHGSANSGTLRATMESRILLSGNRMVDNPGGLNLQASEIEAERNVILDSVWIRPPGMVVLARSILLGAIRTEGGARIRHCASREDLAGEGNIRATPRFTEDGAKLLAATSNYDAPRFLTEYTLPSAALPEGPLAGRPVRLGDRWSVVHSNSPGRLRVWGDSSYQRALELLPSYTLLEKMTGVDLGGN